MTRVVIDILDEDFSLLCEAFGEVELKSTLNLRLQSAVAHGTVLPKGHGDLIDRTALLNEMAMTPIAERNFNSCVECAECMPTIIKADDEVL